MKKLLQTILGLSLMPLLSIGQTTIIIQPNAATGQDAYIDSRLPNTNYGTIEDFISSAWTNSGNPTIVRSFVNFDLTGIPANATINSASLSLYAYNSIGNQTHSTLSGSNASVLQRVTSNWAENAITWNNQPTTTTLNEVTLAATTSTNQNYTNIDVTNLVVDMKNNPSTSFGFMLKLVTEQYYRKMVFASSDNLDANLLPKLEITYTVPSSTCIILQPNAVNGQDAYIDSRLPNTNYGAIEDFISSAWTNSGSPTIVRSLVNFDLTGIPPNATINSASLSLYAYNSVGNQTHSTLSGSNASTLQRVTSNWAENSVTWNTQPTTTALNQVTLAASTSTNQNYTNIDVTNLVVDMQNNPSSSFGFMLKLITEQYYRKMVFASSDNLDANLHPKLEICYTTGVGIKEITKTNLQLEIYPNPASSFVTININNLDAHSCSMSLIDCLGKVVYQSDKIPTENNTLHKTLDFSDYSLPKGLYILNIKTDNQSISKKLIID